jgi:HAD superfamily phosphatase (TIGR01668 family)
MYNMIESINPTTLTTFGLRCLFVDIDNTLAKTTDDFIAPKKIEWLNLVSNQGIRIVLLSNNQGKRIDQIATQTGLETYSFALKPISKYYRLVSKKYGYQKHEIGVIGDQVLTDILGGKLRGYRTFYVTPISSKDTVFTSITRKFERMFMRQWTK